MNLITKRHIAAWVLLATYLPMLLFSSLHLHNDEGYGETTCAECVQHQCHGHLSQFSDGMHQCLLCQFLTLSYVSNATKPQFCYQPKSKVSYAQYCQIPCRIGHDFVSLRAPPTV
ncbi:MAG: hypothetical protein J6T78_01405 [Bacteroidaceae bacterium]|nr:hypothetical protein [Bacteroidaceae bacterium]